MPLLSAIHTVWFGTLSPAGQTSRFSRTTVNRGILAFVKEPLAHESFCRTPRP
jgi:hypothetical protein